MCSIASWEQCAFPTDSYKLTSNGNCELRPGKHIVRWRQHFFWKFCIFISLSNEKNQHDWYSFKYFLVSLVWGRFVKIWIIRRLSSIWFKSYIQLKIWFAVFINDIFYGKLYGNDISVNLSKQFVMIKRVC